LVSLGTSLGFPLCLAIALTHTDASHAGIVLALLPILTSVIGAKVSREKHSAKFWMMAFSGFLTVFSYGDYILDKPSCKM
jgi:drug/metabolite transporter (DMT)-like permease